MNTKILPDPRYFVDAVTPDCVACPLRAYCKPSGKPCSGAKPSEPKDQPVQADMFGIDPADVLLTVDQAAAIMNIKPKTLYEVRRLGLPGPIATKVGRCLRYRRRDIEAYLDARRSRSTSSALGGRDD